MNDNTPMTSASGASLIPDGISALTTAHFAIMAIFAAFVVFGIIWGIRLRHARRQANRTIVADNADIAHRRDADHQPTTPAAAPPPETDEALPSDPAPLANEPIPAAAPFEASPAIDETVPHPTPAPDTTIPAAAIPAATMSANAIPVTTLKGLGPKVAARLAELGITDARQLAALDDHEAAALDAQLGAFAGRMARDRWIDQARLLAAGDTEGYKATFGNL
ncbi:hypothetical protein [Sphingomonas oligophenolica]|uniref:Uncharacterized protein n=1 Tax=Sphingomonas oligophenolica TaxID=301154 RepID=A0A502CKZ3_9SPHN|nr:hypothetical protein [Sphingomonas oligophenolica]TPG13588.1 hypothetical protein EAH84_05215 [Sphingomonas oligophenolica]